MKQSQLHAHGAVCYSNSAPALKHCQVGEVGEASSSSSSSDEVDEAETRREAIRKIKRKHAFKSHILTKKETKQKRNLTQTGLVHESDVKNIKQQLCL